MREKSVQPADADVENPLDVPAEILRCLRGFFGDGNVRSARATNGDFASSRHGGGLRIFDFDDSRHGVECCVRERAFHELELPRVCPRPECATVCLAEFFENREQVFVGFSGAENDFGHAGPCLAVAVQFCEVPEFLKWAAGEEKLRLVKRNFSRFEIFQNFARCGHFFCESRFARGLFATIHFVVGFFCAQTFPLTRELFRLCCGGLVGGGVEIDEAVFARPEPVFLRAFQGVETVAGFNSLHQGVVAICL